MNYWSSFESATANAQSSSVQGDGSEEVFELELRERDLAHHLMVATPRAQMHRYVLTTEQKGTTAETRIRRLKQNIFRLETLLNGNSVAFPQDVTAFHVRQTNMNGNSVAFPQDVTAFHVRQTNMMNPSPVVTLSSPHPVAQPEPLQCIHNPKKRKIIGDSGIVESIEEHAEHEAKRKVICSPTSRLLPPS